MTGKACDHPHCWAPESTCNLGEDDPTVCPHWHGTGDATDETAAAMGQPLPWSGGTLGMVDLQFVAGRSRPTVIGVVGPHDAGKTTFLTAIYLSLSQGHRLPGRQFAGSYTLGGWENLAHALRWHPGQEPRFPAHTPAGAGRRPGLLHLAFRDDAGALDDVLLADAPGEWFARWAIDQEASEAGGARWVGRNADAFILFADSAALASAARGQARSRLASLAQRLADNLTGRPVAIVWAKSDIPVPQGIQAALRGTFGRLFPGYQEFMVSVRSSSPDAAAGEDFLDVIHWLLTRRESTARTMPSLPIVRHDDPLFALRGQ